MLSWETTYREERSAACPNTPKVITLWGCAGGGQDAWERARRQKAQKRGWPGLEGPWAAVPSMTGWLCGHGEGPLLSGIPSLYLKMSPLNSDPVGLPKRNIILKEPPQKENYTFSALSIPSSYNPDNQHLRTFDTGKWGFQHLPHQKCATWARLVGRRHLSGDFLAKTPRLWSCRAFPTIMGHWGRFTSSLLGLWLILHRWVQLYVYLWRRCEHERRQDLWDATSTAWHKRSALGIGCAPRKLVTRVTWANRQG